MGFRDKNHRVLTNILEILKLRFPNAELSNKLNYSKSNVSDFINGKKAIPDNFLDNLFITFDLDKESIINSINNNIEVDRLNNLIKTEIKEVGFDEFMEAEYLPIKVQAGYLSGLEEKHPITLKKMLVPKEFEKGFYKVIEIEGDSMNDGTPRSICDGDKLLLKEIEGGDYLQKTLPYRTNLFVIVSKEGIVCKQIISQDIQKECIVCHSFNPLHKDYEISFEDIYQLFYIKKLVERKIKF